MPYEQLVMVWQLIVYKMFVSLITIDTRVMNSYCSSLCKYPKYRRL